MTEQDANMNHDCISRGYLLGIANRDDAYGYVSAHDIINAPCYSLQERKTGHWINLYSDNYKCSECGVWWQGKEITECNYCPHCGARMESEDKE